MIKDAAFTLYTGGKGFNIDHNFLFRWSLAILFAARHFPITLCGDSLTKELFIDDLKLPIAEFREIEVPNELNYMPMIAKVYGYKATLDKPFIHIDGDLFVYRKPDDELLNAPCCVQSICPSYHSLTDVLDQARILRPDLNLPATPRTCCAGIVGFNDLAKESQFVDVCLDLANDPNMQSVYKGTQEIWHATSAIEETLIVGYFKDSILPFVDIGDFKNAGISQWMRAGITHLNGGMKNDDVRLRDIEVRLAAMFPEDYKRIWEVWWDKYSLLAR